MLSAVILILIGLLFWEMPTWNLNAADSLMQNFYSKIFALVFIVISIAVSYFVGYDRGKRDFEGRAVNVLKNWKNYKVLSIACELKECREYTYLILQQENDEDDIIIYEKNGVWLPEGIKEGSVIIQEITEKGAKIKIVAAE